MAQSPEGPSGAAPPPKASGDLAAFVIGIVIGLPLGGTVLTLLASLGGALLADFIPKLATGPGWVLVGTVPALALGAWAIVYTRKVMNFVSGGMIGLAAGMLGGVTLCALLFGSNWR